MALVVGLVVRPTMGCSGVGKGLWMVWRNGGLLIWLPGGRALEMVRWCGF